jgi:hypothetical protein
MPGAAAFAFSSDRLTLPRCNVKVRPVRLTMRIRAHAAFGLHPYAATACRVAHRSAAAGRLQLSFPVSRTGALDCGQAHFADAAVSAAALWTAIKLGVLDLTAASTNLTIISAPDFLPGQLTFPDNQWSAGTAASIIQGPQSLHYQRPVKIKDLSKTLSNTEARFPLTQFLRQLCERHGTMGGAPMTRIGSRH